jgi:hypothetical protein
MDVFLIYGLAGVFSLALASIRRSIRRRRLAKRLHGKILGWLDGKPISATEMQAAWALAAHEKVGDLASLEANFKRWGSLYRQGEMRNWQLAASPDAVLRRLGKKAAKALKKQKYAALAQLHRNAAKHDKANAGEHWAAAAYAMLLQPHVANLRNAAEDFAKAAACLEKKQAAKQAQASFPGFGGCLPGSAPGKPEGSLDESLAKKYRWEQSVLLAGLGIFHGNDRALQASIALDQALLLRVDRQNEAGRWAMVQEHLGLALLVAGNREGNAGQWAASAAANRHFLEIVDREKMPRHWAMAQWRLGLALYKLGMQGKSVETLQEAVAALQSSAACLKGEDPEQAAQVQQCFALAQKNQEALLFSSHGSGPRPQLPQQQPGNWRRWPLAPKADTQAKPRKG